MVPVHYIISHAYIILGFYIQYIDGAGGVVLGGGWWLVEGWWWVIVLNIDFALRERSILTTD